VQFQRARGAVLPSAVVEQLQRRQSTPGAAERANEQRSELAIAGANVAAADSLQVHALTALPRLGAQAGADAQPADPSMPGRTDDMFLVSRTDGAQALRSGAWLIEGDPEEVRAFLRGLAETADRQGGYTLLTAEVPVADVLALLPAVPAATAPERAAAAPGAGVQAEATQDALRLRAGAPAPEAKAAPGRAGAAPPGPAVPAPRGAPAAGADESVRRAQHKSLGAVPVPQQRFRVVVVVQETDAARPPAAGSRK
jgi:hypothetical protein